MGGAQSGRGHGGGLRLIRRLLERRLEGSRCRRSTLFYRRGRPGSPEGRHLHRTRTCPPAVPRVDGTQDDAYRGGAAQGSHEGYPASRRHMADVSTHPVWVR